MKRFIILIVCACFLITPAAAIADAPLTLTGNGGEPVLTLRRQANFYAEGERCGTLIELYADLSLEIYGLGMLDDVNEPVLMYAGRVTEKAYRTVERTLDEKGFMELPEWIETEVLDGDTVTLTASTNRGAHTVGAYSPDGLPFGDIVEAIEAILGAYENTDGE